MNTAYSSFSGQFSNFLTPHINSELSDSFCIGKLELVAFFEKNYQKIGTNFSRGKLERELLYILLGSCFSSLSLLPL